MAKKLPMKYFPGYTATIKYSKLDKCAEYRAKNNICPYFDTWEEAWAFMLNRATKAKERAEKDLAAAKRHLAKVSALKPEGA